MILKSTEMLVETLIFAYIKYILVISVSRIDSTHVITKQGSIPKYQENAFCSGCYQMQN